MQGQFGYCPRCQSRAIRQEFDYEKHNNGWRLGGASIVLFVVGVATFIFGIGIFLIAAAVVLGIVASFIPNRRALNSYRECKDCGLRF